MHTHQSLWSKGKPLFAGKEYAGLSQMALYYVGGILKHAKALAAFCNPTTNSYKRLVPGYEAPVNLAYSARNRSAAIRIPTYSENPKAKRIEYRPPDPAANPYLAFAAMLMAGLDGIQNKIKPGEPMDKNLYELPPEEHAKIPQMPGSLPEALGYLEKDHAFLLKGDVFTKDFVECGSATNSRKPTPSACVRILTNSTCITTYKQCNPTGTGDGANKRSRRFFCFGTALSSMAGKLTKNRSRATRALPNCTASIRCRFCWTKFSGGRRVFAGNRYEGDVKTRFHFSSFCRYYCCWIVPVGKCPTRHKHSRSRSH